MRTQINLKIDDTVKNKAAKRAKELGLSLSSIVNASLSQFAKTGELHVTTSYKMTPYLEKIISEAKREYELGKTARPFSSMEEMIKILES